MIELKKFMTIWIATIVVASSFIVGWIAFSNNPNGSTKVKQGHFSVVWMGFKPTYSDQFPDYYICINNLKDESLQMNIQFKIENYENVSLYFMIDKYVEPPSGWYVGPQYFGLVPIENPIAYFTYYNLNRTKPSAIPEGSIHETVDLVVKAYLDEAYTQFYSQANFTVNFHFLDVTSTAWTRIEYYNFDDGTTQGWYGSLHWWQYYRSWPCSLGGAQKKYIDMVGNYTEAYLIAAVYSGVYNIYLDGVLTFQREAGSYPSSWYQIAIPLPLNKVTLVEIGVSYLDDAYVLAK